MCVCVHVCVIGDKLSYSGTSLAIGDTLGTA